jgi:hypothetical protein
MHDPGSTGIVTMSASLKVGEGTNWGLLTYLINYLITYLITNCNCKFKSRPVNVANDAVIYCQKKSSPGVLLPALKPLHNFTR